MNAIKKFFHWMKLLFSGSDEAGIKRFTGFIMVIAILVILYFVALKLVPLNVWEKIEGFCQFIVITASLYFGVNAIIDVTKIVKGSPKSEVKEPDKQS